MKILISADIEGIEGIYHDEFVDETKTSYALSCQLMTEELNKITSLILKHTENSNIIITDGHGTGNNIIRENLNLKVTLIQNKPGPYGMLDGIENTDYLMLVGYHGMANKLKSYSSHTNSTKLIKQVKIGTRLVSEGIINSFVALNFGVKTIFISGTDKAIKEQLKHQKIPCLIVKKSQCQYKATAVNNITIKREQELLKALNESNSIPQIEDIKKTDPWIITPTYHFLSENIRTHKLKKDGSIIIDKKNAKDNYLAYREILKQLSQNMKKFQL